MPFPAPTVQRETPRAQDRTILAVRLAVVECLQLGAVLECALDGNAQRQRGNELGHAIDFWAWRSLTEGQGLDDEKAALLMTEMVQGMAR